LVNGWSWATPGKKERITIGIAFVYAAYFAPYSLAHSLHAYLNLVDAADKK
jgi:hypothetical protein